MASFTPYFSVKRQSALLTLFRRSIHGSIRAASKTGGTLKVVFWQLAHYVSGFGPMPRAGLPMGPEICAIGPE
jgi:hypothetical protein